MSDDSGIFVLRPIGRPIIKDFNRCFINSSDNLLSSKPRCPSLRNAKIGMNLRLRSSKVLSGVNKCPYCLQYWREESKIFIKFGKVFCGGTKHHQILPLTCINSLPSGDVNLSSDVSTFFKKEDEKSKFSVDFLLYNGLFMSFVSIVP